MDLAKVAGLMEVENRGKQSVVLVTSVDTEGRIRSK